MATQELSLKDAEGFRSLVALYEGGRYPRALKLADQLLSKHPYHGETLSVKALVLSHIPARKGEALEVAKLGLRSNLRSSTCWHVMGALYRTEKNYNEAMRCFFQASRLSPNKFAFTNDLACLQLQERILTGHLVTRKLMFQNRPLIKPHWHGYVLAHHLVWLLCWSIAEKLSCHMLGNSGLAARLLRIALEHFSQFRTEREEGAGKLPPQTTAPDELREKGELDLYLAVLLEEAGDYGAALAHLAQCSGAPDTLGRLEALGRLLIFTGQLKEAHAVYMNLFKKQRADERYLLCACATHPELQSCVKVPSAPYTESPTASVADPPVWLLSPYVLGSPLLNASGAHGWPTHPRDVLYNITGPTQFWDTRLCQVRNPTASEEETLSRWLVKDVFVSGGGVRANETVLLVALRFCSMERRFQFYADAFLRPKILRATPFALQNIRNLCRASPEKRCWIEKLLKSYAETLKVARQGRNLEEKETVIDTISLGCPPRPPCEIEDLIEKSSQTHEADSVRCTQTTDTERVVKNRCWWWCQQCREEECRALQTTTHACYSVCLLSLAFLAESDGKMEEALNLVDTVLQDTPTFIEARQLRAAILKQMGASNAAAETYNAAREMDLADRFLNTQCVKFLLKANRVVEAGRLALYFSRQGTEDNLKELQCMWYEMRLGRAYLRLRQWSLAAAYFRTVLGHFEEMKHDQFDFHAYCIRRGALRSYVQFLRMEDRLEAQKWGRGYLNVLSSKYRIWKAGSQPASQSALMCTVGHRYYRQAAGYLIRVLLDVYDGRVVVSTTNEKHGPKILPPAGDSAKENGTTSITIAMTAQEFEKQWRANEAIHQVEGDLYLTAEGQPLDEAYRLVTRLRKAAQLDPETHCLAYEVAFRKNLLLLMVQSLYRLSLITRDKNDQLSEYMTPLLYHFLTLYKLRLRGEHPRNLSFALPDVMEKDWLTLQPVIRTALQSLMASAGLTEDTDVLATSAGVDAVLQTLRSRCIAHLARLRDVLPTPHNKLLMTLTTALKVLRYDQELLVGDIQNPRAFQGCEQKFLDKRPDSVETGSSHVEGLFLAVRDAFKWMSDSLTSATQPPINAWYKCLEATNALPLLFPYAQAALKATCPKIEMPGVISQ